MKLEVKKVLLEGKILFYVKREDGQYWSEYDDQGEDMWGNLEDVQLIKTREEAEQIVDLEEIINDVEYLFLYIT